VTGHRDAEYTEYVTARLPSLRRLALLLSQDSCRADDLVQAAIIKVYVQWSRAAAADNIDAYVNTIVVREFLHERRSSWSRRVSLTGELPERAALQVDHDRCMDLEAAVAALPPRQRATLVLRFYCDLNVDQCADLLGCTQGTVKSQTAKALSSLRRTMAARPDLPEAVGPTATISTTGRMPDHA